MTIEQEITEFFIILITLAILILSIILITQFELFFIVIFLLIFVWLLYTPKVYLDIQRPHLIMITVCWFLVLVGIYVLFFNKDPRLEVLGYIGVAGLIYIVRSKKFNADTKSLSADSLVFIAVGLIALGVLSRIHDDIGISAPLISQILMSAENYLKSSHGFIHFLWRLISAYTDNMGFEFAFYGLLVIFALVPSKKDIQGEPAKRKVPILLTYRILWVGSFAAMILALMYTIFLFWERSHFRSFCTFTIVFPGFIIWYESFRMLRRELERRRASN